jgi:YHS domain-containing protein
MDRRRAIAALAACLGGTALAQSNPSKLPAVAIKGYDPVSYFVDGRAVKGFASITHDFDDSRYLFSSARNRELFAANPERYLPQFHGLCAAGLADGRIVEPDPTAFVVRDGKLYLFQGPKGVQRVEKDPSLLTKAHQAYRK